jgi:hypothetical protein
MVTDTQLLGRILAFLKELRNEVTHPGLEKMIEDLSKMVPITVAGEVREKAGEQTEGEELSRELLYNLGPVEEKTESLLKRFSFTPEQKIGEKATFPFRAPGRKIGAPRPELFRWGGVLEWLHPG